MSQRSFLLALIALLVCPLVLAFAGLSLREQEGEETMMTTAIIIEEMIVEAIPPEIAKTEASEIVVFILTDGLPAPAREVTFRIDHGNSSRHGTIAPPMAITDEAGMASAVYTPQHPGKIHIKVESGSLVRELSVKVRP
jgi:hypothetical protein